MSPPAQVDHYAALGVPRDASDADVRRVFRERSQYEHPDKLPATAPAGVRAAWDARFAVVSAAYSVLSDPDRRAAYDAEVSLVGAGTAAELEAILAFAGEVQKTILSSVAPGETPRSFARRFASAAALDAYRLAASPGGRARVLDALRRLGGRSPPRP